MDKITKFKIKRNAGKVYFNSKDFEELIFDYIFAHPKITAEELADARVKPKKEYNSPTEWKICSPTVAQKYLDIVKQCTK